MAAFSNYTENKIIDLLLRGQPFTPPATLYIALFTAATNDAAGGTEVSGASYARAAVTANLSNFSGTQGAGTTAASSGNSGASSNNVEIPFATPTGAWGNVVGWGVFDALTGGNLLFHALLGVPQTINSGNVVAFAPASLSLTVD